MRKKKDAKEKRRERKKTQKKKDAKEKRRVKAPLPHKQLRDYEAAMPNVGLKRVQ